MREFMFVVGLLVMVCLYRSRTVIPEANPSRIEITNSYERLARLHRSPISRQEAIFNLQ